MKVDDMNVPPNMSDTELSLFIEAKKKSILATILLNLFLPGAGYIYCGRRALGIIAFLLVIAMWNISSPILVIGTFILVFVIDGVLCTKKYNRILIENALNARRKEKDFI